MKHPGRFDILLHKDSVKLINETDKFLCERKVSTGPDDFAVLLTSVCGDSVRFGIIVGRPESAPAWRFQARHRK